MHDHQFHTILLTGVPGVGKTSLADRIAAKYSITPMNFGDFLFKLIKDKNIGGINHIDDIRDKLEPQTCQQLQLETAARMNEHQDAHRLIVSHLSIDTSYGFVPGFPKTVIEILHPCLTILVEAPAKEVRARREADPSNRKRGQHLEDWVDYHQDLNRSLAANYSFYTSNFILPVLNKQGEMDQAFAELELVLDKYLLK